MSTTGVDVVEGTGHMDEATAEMRLLAHLVSSAVCVHGTLAQEQIDEILDLAVTPCHPQDLIGQPIPS